MDTKHRFLSLLEEAERKGSLVLSDKANSLSMLDAAENYLKEKNELADKGYLHRYLNLTSDQIFMKSLGKTEARERWAETAFRSVFLSGYKLVHMLEDRVKKHPDRVLFKDMTGRNGDEWTYEQVGRHLMELAVLFNIYTHNAPKVAIFSDNGVESACCDLACLCYDILVTPLNVQFGPDVIEEIFRNLEINIVVTDTEERLKILDELRKTSGLQFLIFLTTDKIRTDNEKKVYFLGEACKKLNRKIISETLASRKQFDIEQVCTVMYTSGSTGRARGVSFSGYNIVTKRFARAAALPEVGRDEVLLCYLPLFHTFGRYFELLGAIYWRGTYVFAGNPSAETLMVLFPIVEPTGFISIPLRWQQLYDTCVEKQEAERGIDSPGNVIREVLGRRLKWGISAAGFLDSKVFRFFGRHGIALCSGFGMTEATGGITMTPPGKYIDNTTGLPLPGIQAELGKDNEMFISGHYVARYLEEKAPGDIIPSPYSTGGNYKLGTGDIFRRLPNGYYEIVDRIKDIYKNNRGQTVAPKNVENKFTGVPGIKQVFLVGDGKAYNTLLIVPDNDDDLLKSLKQESARRDYFHKIVNMANIELAPYERVINFAVINRQFSREKGELTAKGSYNRRIIEGNFSGIIDDLYVKNFMEIYIEGLKIKIPRWFFRDLGLLEDDIQADNSCLRNRLRNTTLKILRIDEHRYLIGDMVYEVRNRMIDLGVFALHPGLWCGNPELMKFAPCKEGWDIVLNDISLYAHYPVNQNITYDSDDLPILPFVRDYDISVIASLVASAFFEVENAALISLDKIEQILLVTDDRKAGLIRRRLSALSHHSIESIRCAAYRILLLDEPGPDDNIIFPPFVKSGLSFLTSRSVEEIAAGRLEKRRLDALRRRLFIYREQFSSAASSEVRHQFEHIFQILVLYAESDPEYTRAVRSELAAWIMYKQDPELSDIAEHYFYRLVKNYKRLSRDSGEELDLDKWNKYVIFDRDVNINERAELKNTLASSDFLKLSIEIALEERGFRFEDIVPGGIYISRITFPDESRHYRISVDMLNGKHYDIHLLMLDDADKDKILNLTYLHLSIRAFPYGSPVLPQIGWFSTENKAVSSVYTGSRTLLEIIKKNHDLEKEGWHAPCEYNWRKAFIIAMAAVFRAWNNNGCRFVPLPISAGNVTIPEPDYLDGAMLISLTDYEIYVNPLSIIIKLIDQYYKFISINYPGLSIYLDTSWIYDACLEGLGEEKGREFLQVLIEESEVSGVTDYQGIALSESLDTYIRSNKIQCYIPLPVHNAIDSYSAWLSGNPGVTNPAKEQAVQEVFRLYRINRYPEAMRYYLYRHTYFKESKPEINKPFDMLLNEILSDRSKPAVRLIELSDLQSAISGIEDRNVFSRLVFPRREREFEFIRLDGSADKSRLVIQSKVSDKHGVQYTFRSPIRPSEVGGLYRLFYKENYALRIYESDKYYILTDSDDKLAGGICFRYSEHKTAYLEGCVVISSLQHRGLGRAMIDEFCAHLANQGVKALKTHFFLPEFLISSGFRIDARKGALIRNIG